MAARSLVDGGAIAQGSANDRETARGIVPATWTPPERRFDTSADEIKAYAEGMRMPGTCVKPRSLRWVNRPRTIGPPLFQCGARRMQGNSPGLVAENPVPCDAAPRLKRHDSGLCMRPEIDVDPLWRCVPLPWCAVDESETIARLRDAHDLSP